MSSKPSRSARWQDKLKGMPIGSSVFLQGERPSKLTHIYKAASVAGVQITMTYVECDEIYQVAGTRVARRA